MHLKYDLNNNFPLIHVVLKKQFGVPIQNLYSNKWGIHEAKILSQHTW
jgi:hypothetical protein